MRPASTNGRQARAGRWARRRRSISDGGNGAGFERPATGGPRRLCLRPGQAGAVHPAADQLGRCRPVEAVAGARPALRRRTAPTSLSYTTRAADQGGAHHGPAAGRPVRRDQRHRQRLGGEADRRLSQRNARRRDRRASKPDMSGYRAADRDRDLPRPLRRQLRQAARAAGRQGRALSLRPAQREPRVPARPPDHGAGPVEPVPALRPQPADVRAEHLLREGRAITGRRRRASSTAARPRARCCCRSCPS